MTLSSDIPMMVISMAARWRFTMPPANPHLYYYLPPAHHTPYSPYHRRTFSSSTASPAAAVHRSSTRRSYSSRGQASGQKARTPSLYFPDWIHCQGFFAKIVQKYSQIYSRLLKACFSKEIRFLKLFILRKSGKSKTNFINAI